MRIDLTDSTSHSPPPRDQAGRAEDVQHQSLRARISQRMVQLHKEFYGKGPTKAKTYLMDDLVVVVLEGGFTAVEKTLLAQGRRESVMRQRSAFQEVMCARFTEAITELTGRNVISYVSGNSDSPDLSIETFILEAPAARQQS